MDRSCSLQLLSRHTTLSAKQDTLTNAYASAFTYLTSILESGDTSSAGHKDENVGRVILSSFDTVALKNAFQHLHTSIITHLTTHSSTLHTLHQVQHQLDTLKQLHEALKETYEENEARLETNEERISMLQKQYSESTSSHTHLSSTINELKREGEEREQLLKMIAGQVEGMVSVLCGGETRKR